MNDTEPSQSFFRSPNLLNTSDSALLIVDAQEKLMPHIRDYQRVVWNIGRLIEGSRILGVNIHVTQQYPRGLGNTVQSLRELLTDQLGDVREKTMFSCRECEELFEGLRQTGIEKLVLVGIESHVCVAQTAFDLISAGFDIYLCVDAIGSRFQVDHETAIRRMENAGVYPTTTEAVLFEWCEKSGSEAFKRISRLVRDQFG